MSNPGAHEYEGHATSRHQGAASKLGHAISVERMEALLGKRPPLDEAKVLPPQRPDLLGSGEYHYEAETGDDPDEWIG